MPRGIWSGSINFGLVNVPVRLVTAVREQTVRFHMLSPDGSCRLRQKLYCPETGKEFNFKETARGYEIAPGQYVLMEDEELKRLKPEAGRSIDIDAFVDLEEIDPIYFDRTYYLAPDEKAAKAYGLLVTSMHENSKVAIAQFVMRDQQHLATLRSNGRIIILHTMYYDDEIVDEEDLEGMPRTSRPAAGEIKMADQLIKALSGPFEAAKYKDDFRDKLRKAIEAKAEGQEVVTAVSEEPAAPPVYNLMEALKRSLAEAEKQTSSRSTPRKRRKSA
jgi:DNA end-binding protein Ku